MKCYEPHKVGQNLTIIYNITHSTPPFPSIDWEINDSEGFTDSGSGYAGSQTINVGNPKDFNKAFSYTVHFNITFLSGGGTYSAVLIPRYPNSLQQCAKEVLLKVTDSSMSASIRFVGRTQQPPTYLEQLYKLDNYTNAQYIPRYRR